MPRRRLLWLSTGVVILLLSIGAASPPAQAHNSCIEKTFNFFERGVACNRSQGASDHFSNWVDGCDRFSDGWSVRAWYTFQGTGDFPGSWDPNGANPGCANDNLTWNLRRQKICVEVAGCSGWRDH